MPHPDSDALVALLPHRPPFRFVDSVDQVVPATHIEARYRVTGDEEFLQGHFPGQPDVSRRDPARGARAGGRDHARSATSSYAGKLALFGGVEKVRFRRIVRPGDELLLVVQIEKLERAGWLGPGDSDRQRRNRLRSEDALRRYLTPIFHWVRAVDW